jgi:hypothetical protein
MITNVDTIKNTIEKNIKDYNNGKIYQVLNNINDDVFVGSTCQTIRRCMVLYRQDSVARQGLVYDEMRRLGKEHFYIELIENYPCNNKGELESRLNFFIKERSTLNSKTKQDTSTDAPEQSYTTNHMLEIKEMMRDLHTRIC